MGFRLANVDGQAVLVDGTDYYAVAELSDGQLSGDPMAAITDSEALHRLGAALSDADPSGSLDDVTLGAPVPRPRNSFAVGLNYRAHVAEADMEVPEVPLVFTKFPSCIVGPQADIELRSDTGDYEAELVAVIGTSGRDIAEADAWDHVAGVTVGQDVSDRGLQFAAKPPHFDLGKSRDTYGPTGPVLVSTDLLADRDDLAITCDVNGERRQDGSTANLIFTVPELVAYISTIVTLEPGDLIFTGTPDGVGAPQGLFLKPGDVVTTTIDGIGTMTNRCT
ncbi:MAG: fumarylacetoacetate hydrolase family protein [Acidimicrobiia bacterium]|nr:fumarylacetoacetate hydrolase family protein [Acidimicrobiia bacterium]